MTDKELTELAAKAANVPGTWHDDLGCFVIGARRSNNCLNRYWVPIFDDGDALRLAVKLNLSMDILSVRTCVDFDYVPTGNRCVQEISNGDPQSATRRAIVRAAAEIGKSVVKPNSRR